MTRRNTFRPPQLLGATVNGAYIDCGACNHVPKLGCNGHQFARLIPFVGQTLLDLDLALKEVGAQAEEARDAQVAAAGARTGVRPRTVGGDRDGRRLILVARRGQIQRRITRPTARQTRPASTAQFIQRAGREERA